MYSFERHSATECIELYEGHDKIFLFDGKSYDAKNSSSLRGLAPIDTAYLTIW